MAVSSRIQLLQSEQTEFRKGLGLFSATTLVMGSMIGSGVFVVASGMLQKVPYSGMMILVWVVCGVITLMGALSYAEMAASMPKAGGPYVYLREAFGSFWAFLYGWTLFFAIQTGTIAAVAVVFGRAGYALFSNQPYGSVNAEAWPVKFLALGCLAFLTFWNVFGIRMGAMLQNVFTVLKVGAIVVLIAAAFTHPTVANVANPGASAWPLSWGDFRLWSAFGTAMIGALWAYDAWFNVMFAGEEVVNAKRTLPLSLIYGTALVMLLYVLCNWVYVHVLPVGQIQNLQNVKGIVGVEAAKAMLGAGGALFITIAILCSTFGCTNGILLSGPRAYYALAKDRLFFRQIGDLHPLYKTPVLALVVQLIWSSLLVVSGTYDQLFTYVEFATFLFYAITICGLFVLRNKYPDLPRPFKVPTLVPVIYFLLVAAFLFNTLWTQKIESLIGIGIIGVGAVVYLFIGKKNESLAA